jgi:hypothetical protein
MAVHAPASYVGLKGMDPSAGSGRDLLSTSRTSDTVRPVIPMKGGKRKTLRRKQRRQRKQRSQRKQRGGFLPSIGEGFAAAAAKYAAPIALLGLYKLLNKTKSKSKRLRRTRRR